MASRLRRSFRRRSSTSSKLEKDARKAAKDLSDRSIRSESRRHLDVPNTISTETQDDDDECSSPAPMVRRMTSGTIRMDDSVRLDLPIAFKQLDFHDNDDEDTPFLDTSSLSSLEGDNQQKRQQQQHEQQSQCVTECTNSKRDPEAMKVQEIFASFSELDKETAARTSWKYFNEVGQHDNITDIPRRDGLARAMIRRHLADASGDTDTACKSVHATLTGRRDEKMDWHRTAWHIDSSWAPERKQFSAMVRDTMNRWLGPHGRVCVLDYGKDDRCQFYHRLSISTQGTRYFREGVLYSASYMLEKALACSERRSNGRQTQVDVVLDFRDVNMRDKSKTLPIRIALELVELLKHHYPQRLYTVYMIDAPFLARLAWPIFRPFVNHIVQGGIRFVTGKRQILEIFGAKMLHYDRASNLDMEKFYQLPFDQAYGDVHGNALEY